MSDASVIVSTVTTDPTLISLIVDRIYPLVLPLQPDLPAVTYQLVSQPGEHTQEGAAYRHPRWRFRIVAERHADLVPIADALAAVFSSPFANPFRSSWVDGGAEGWEPDTGRYWRLIDIVGFQPAGGTQ